MDEEIKDGKLTSLNVMVDMAQTHIRLIESANKQINKAMEGLESIASNSCCGSCQENKLIAEKTINEINLIARKSYLENQQTHK